VKSGRVRAIASTNPKRGIGPFGELPVLAETIPDFELVTWHGVMVPAATPRDIVLRLNREIQSVLGDPDIRRRFADGGLDIRGGTPEEFGAILKRDYTKYGKTLTGAGINPEFLPYIFERFRQVHSPQMKPYAGLGLGLAIVKDLVAMHGGTIIAESDGPTRGACFTVSFPSA